MSRSIALVGAGPRGVAVAARLVADLPVLAPGTQTVVHLIDGVAVGAGRTWRRDQHPLLLNNTYCAETTVFADESVPTAAPGGGGPSLAEWLGFVAASPGAFPERVAAEAARSRPWSYPSRALQGAYFRWALERVVASAPEGLRFVEHRASVAGLEEAAGGAQRLLLADGGALEADVVVLAQGLLTAERSPEAARLAGEASARGLTYVPPGMPSERDWDALPAGEDALVRGLGANFFDLVGVLFEGRGGRFARGADGRLAYEPSGREPRLLAGSRRGLPYRGKAYFGEALPTALELPRFSAAREAELVAAHGGREDVDFARDLLPEIRADFRDLYEETAGRSGRAHEAFDWDLVVDPAHGRAFGSEDEWARFLDGYFAGELAGIHDPDSSPHKAVHRAMETARRRLTRLVLARVLDPLSAATDLKRPFLADSLVIASGPPPERLERLEALRRAGLVEVLGPGLRVEVGADGFVATTAVPGQRRTARLLVEARMSLGDVTAADDPLVRSLLETGAARLHRARGQGGERVTRTLDVTRDDFLLIDAGGRPHERRIVLGPPAGDVQPNAAIGAIPHTGDKMLVGADRAAAHALRVVAALEVPPAASGGGSASGGARRVEESFRR